MAGSLGLPAEFGLQMQVTNAWAGKGAKLELLQQLLLFSLARSGVAAIMKRAGGEYLYAANIPDCWPIPPDGVPTHRRIFGEELGAIIEGATARSVATDEVVVLNVSHRETDRRFEFAFERVMADGTYFLLVTIVETTEEFRREQRLRAILRELNHRTKNLLAIVQSIAAQTARSSMSLPGFLARFNGRVYSLARSQDLVVDTSWNGARLHDLIRAQAGKYVDQPSQFLTLTGIDPLLDPNEALHVGLAIHELFIDAISVGEAGQPFPLIEIDCRRVVENGENFLEIRWEQTNPAIDGLDEEQAGDPDRFASSVLTRITPTAVGGTATLFNDGVNVRYTLRFPHAL